ncbi:hypothetical protein WKT22_02489 [Candidatus Lokiarchaeum ossiferum]
MMLNMVKKKSSYIPLKINSSSLKDASLARYNKLISFYNSHPLFFVDFNGYHLDYIAAGSGNQTILIFHGASGNAYTTYEIISKYESQYRVIAPSITQFTSIDDLCDGINFILDREKVGNVIIRSGSFGSMVAQAYFHRNTSRVDGIILANSYPPKTEWNKSYKQMVVLLKILPEKIIRKVVAHKLLKYFENVPENLTPDQREQFSFMKAYYVELFKQVPKSVIVCQSLLTKLWNYKDSAITRDYSNWNGKALIFMSANDSGYPYLKEFAAPFIDPHIHVFKNEGHLVSFTQEAEYDGIIDEFLKSLV